MQKIGKFGLWEKRLGLATAVVMQVYLIALAVVVGILTGFSGEGLSALLVVAVPWLLSLPVALGARFHAASRKIGSLLMLTAAGLLMVLTLAPLGYLVFLLIGFSGWGISFLILTNIPLLLANGTILTGFFNQFSKKGSGE
ncbi:MAG: hypothetical protein JSS81_20595 [Acidobacteria bacterium]|nr:hypothetical protein [Acidobacteriota bacterium]